MGKIDDAMNQYVAIPERFAEIAGYGIFHDTKVLSAEKLKELDSASWKKGAVTNVRDVVKMYDEKLCLMIVGIENQNKVHYLMPLRVMDYDVRSYVKQSKEITKRHREKKDLKTPEEILSGFSKEDSDAIKSLAGSDSLAECIEHSREGKVIHMCKAIKDWEAKSERIGEKRGERRGEKRGEERGRKLGEEQLLISLISKKIKKGKTILEIADALEMSEEEIQKVYGLAERKLKKSA